MSTSEKRECKYIPKYLISGTPENDAVIEYLVNTIKIPRNEITPENLNDLIIKYLNYDGGNKITARKEESKQFNNVIDEQFKNFFDTYII